MMIASLLGQGERKKVRGSNSIGAILVNDPHPPSLPFRRERRPTITDEYQWYRTIASTDA